MAECVSPICSVISANVRTRFVLCRTMAPISICVLWRSFLNCNSDSCFAPRLGLILSFPWLLSHLPLQQSHDCLLGPPSISICSCSNDVSWHLSDFVFLWKSSIQLCSYLPLLVIVLLLCVILGFVWLFCCPLLQKWLHVISPQGQMVQMCTVTLSTVCGEWKLQGQW